MADTKVSGLAAAASFQTTHELPVNEAGTSKKITGAQIMASVAQGTLSGGYVQVTANQGGIVAAYVDLTSLTVTVTPASGSRRLRLSVEHNVISGVAADSYGLQIMEGATILATAYILLGGIGIGSHVQCSVIITPTLAAHTYKVQGSRVNGTGTQTLVASATQPAFLLCEDIGT